MEEVEQINRGEILALNNGNVYGPHETGSRHTKIISHHDDALDSASIAMPQRLHQFRILLVSLRMEPLLELVQHQQYLLARGKKPPLTQRRQGFDEAEIGRQTRHLTAQALQQAGWKFIPHGAGGSFLLGGMSGVQVWVHPNAPSSANEAADALTT